MCYLGPWLGTLHPSWPVLRVFPASLGFKNALCKIMQIPCKKQCLVLGRALDGAKMDPRRVFFFLLQKLVKSYFFLAKNRVSGTTPHPETLSQKLFSCFLAKKVVFHNPWFYLSQTEVFEGEGHYFWGFWRLFFSLFLGPVFFSSCSQFFATYGSASVKLKIAGLHTFNFNMKNLIFCVKNELQTMPFKNTFFELLFCNLWFRLSQTEVFGGLGG